MKQTLYSLITLLLLSISFDGLQATHFMGVDISYECTGPCTYRITHKTYYDCNGGATQTPVYPPPTVTTPAVLNAVNAPFLDFIGLSAGCVPPTPIGNWFLVSYFEVTPLCPDAINPPPGTPSSTRCDDTNPGAALFGVSEAVFTREYNFCNSPNCSGFLIEWETCCRNAAITSIANPTGATTGGIYTGETTIDLTLTPCNSSPFFQNKPVPYICAGQLFTFNQGAIDPDGDSLSYELGPCYVDPAVTVTYLNGHGPQAPLGPTWDVSVNPLTGDVTMTPTPTGAVVVGVVCIVVKEWRNGVQIGQVVRDMQITVIPNCTSSNPITGGIQPASVTIGPDSVPAFPLSYNEARTCAGSEICFDIPVISQDPNLFYTLSWNQNIPGATFTDASNSTIQNTISGAAPVATFCWTPPLTATGAYFFTVSVNDDACPVPGFNQYTIIIYVDDVLETSQALGNYVGCNEMELVALPVSTIPSIYNNIFPVTEWSGNGNLQFNPNTSDSSFNHLYPAPGLYNFNLQLQDTFGCSVVIPGFTILPGGVTADAGSDVSICSNFNFPLGTPGIPGQYYSWNPGTALSDPTLAQPTFMYPNTGSVQDTLNYILTVTDSVCTTVDYTRVIVNPTLQTSIFPNNPVICIGDQSVLSATGNILGGNTYLWSTGDTSQSITVNPTSTTTYSVVSFNNGCSSDEIFVTVNVTVGPPALVSGDFQVCPGGSTTLTASGGDSYLWSAGSFTQPSITLAGLNTDSTLWVIAYDANGCPGDTTFVTVQAYDEPIADFSTPTICQGLSSSFSDLSTINEGSIVGWTWDFDDNTTSTDQNPVHNYASPGNYDVSLTVTSSNGCVSTFTRQIVVEPVPVADFNFTNACEGDANTFQQTAGIQLGSVITGYSWNFGDSNTATGTNTSHTYAGYGYYNVTLSVVSDAGCTDDFTRTVFVNPNPIADFEIVSACEDSLVLASSASTVAGSLDYISNHDWEFGDPSSGSDNNSTRINPSHVYNSAGFYDVTLTVTTQNGCTNTIQRNIEIFPDPVANFTYDETCENVFTEFIDRSQSVPSTPIDNWSWDFGDGNEANVQFPDNKYSLTSGAGTYDVRLAVQTTAGCVDTLTQSVLINPRPYPGFAVKEVCFGDTSKFFGGADIAEGNIASWSWDFGDGSTSSLQNPEYLYTVSDIYRAGLTAVSDSGCAAQVFQNVMVSPLPNLTTITNDTVCFGNQAFLLATTEPTSVIRWYASLDDVDNKTPLYTGFTYTTPPLPLETTYYIEGLSDRGCISVPQPVTAFIYESRDLTIVPDKQVVELPFGLVNFASTSTIDLTDWSWTFGDGNTSNASDPAHEYQYPGRYEVRLQVTDINGCEMETIIPIEVKQIIEVYLPSAFTPNQDGRNDTYKIGAYNINFEAFNIQIFGRWGQKIYESSDPNFAWDGKDLQGANVPEGVYVYHVRYQDNDGNDYFDSRTITLLR
ncbi:MAG: PKD domain-containing protein [Bacteroidota bacterium]